MRRWQLPSGAGSVAFLILCLCLPLPGLAARRSEGRRSGCCRQRVTGVGVAVAAAWQRALVASPAAGPLACPTWCASPARFPFPRVVLQSHQPALHRQAGLGGRVSAGGWSHPAACCTACAAGLVPALQRIRQTAGTLQALKPALLPVSPTNVAGTSKPTPQPAIPLVPLCAWAWWSSHTTAQSSRPGSFTRPLPRRRRPRATLDLAAAVWA